MIYVIEEGSCSYSKPDRKTYIANMSISHPPPDEQASTYTEPLMEELDKVPLDPVNPDRTVPIGSRLEAGRRQELITFLAEHKDWFAWTHEDMTEIDPSIITYHLRVDPAHPPVKQKRRKFAPDKNRVIDEEVQKLINIGSVVEVKYPE